MNLALLKQQLRVILAVMLRNIRTRFFGHGVGFLISVGWPLVHIVILLLINSAMDRAAPYGESLVVFFTTGLVPFMTFMYMSRFTMLSVINNRSLLAFPAVKVLDLLLAGALLEVASSCLMIIILIMLLGGFGIDLMPVDPVEASMALGASMLLGFGFGVVNSVIAMAAPTWMTGYALLQITLYLLSGILFTSDSLPETVRYYLSFLPTLQIVEWMRSAYYDGYGALILDKTYAVGFGAVSLLAGLLLERFLRGRLLTVR